MSSTDASSLWAAMAHDALPQDPGRLLYGAGGHGSAPAPGRPRTEGGDGGVALDGGHVLDIDAERVRGQLHDRGLDAVAGGSARLCTR